jgi:hypothetical protein
MLFSGVGLGIGVLDSLGVTVKFQQRYVKFHGICRNPLCLRRMNRFGSPQN